MNSLFGHTWCNCLECDNLVEAMSIMVIEHRNRDSDLGMALVHFAHSDPSDTMYNVFGELYLICNRHGDILDPMYYDDDDDEDDPDPWEPDDDCCGYSSVGHWLYDDLGESDELDGSLILRMLRR